MWPKRAGVQLMPVSLLHKAQEGGGSAPEGGLSPRPASLPPAWPTPCSLPDHPSPALPFAGESTRPRRAEPRGTPAGGLSS